MRTPRTSAALLGAALLAGALTAPPALAEAPNRAPATATLAAAPRLATATNFRDLGGYATADGHHVRTGVVYRSNSLAHLSAADQQTLLGLGITLDVDLRNYKERSEDPDLLPAGITYQVADVEDLTHGISFANPALGSLLYGFLIGLVTGSSNLGQSIAYPFMVDFSGASRAYHDLLTSIAANPGATVFHCTAGKDRTGWGAAVLLTILGVPKATVYQDYMASNTYLGRSDAVESAWLDEAFHEVDQAYGSFDNYVRNGLKLSDATVAALRSRLLTS
ncbi:tyrosine-protein phosphatase [Actinomadura geliboluensis]|uniref:Tyrosine-protein phosphatase n=1 Tax=Actinomadura geliboluensis TaxID=882440 RepID=A0A5S4GBD8_9ACTN|nr:tyrosine-protein phosphatase [Actinomadura geliboluensis]TMR29781.1 tyrosine-protein phosphatase [Actinomadura geliboluensis]